MKRRDFLRQGIPVVTVGVLTPSLLFANKQRANDSWHIEQFLDRGLAQFTYALLYDKKIILIDPARDPSPFYQYAKEHEATIVGVMETHPHADFISSHADIQRNKDAVVYVSRKVKAKYPHKALDAGDVIPLNGQLRLKILDTPGHSPDSISVVLEDRGKDVAVFSGDALLFGDVGRPDLREYAGSYDTQRNALAKEMYHTIHEKFARLADDVVVYPAHGAGSLCGNAIRDVRSSTIGYERAHNYAFKNHTEAAFVALLLKDLSYIPKYFPYDVELNRTGAPDVAKSLSAVKLFSKNFEPKPGELVVDTRSAEALRYAYLPDAISIPDGTKFETWLGTVVPPDKEFYLVAENPDKLSALVEKVAKIGYEGFIKGAFVYDRQNEYPFSFDDAEFSKNINAYTIIDVRNPKEVQADTLFQTAINIPLPELLSRLSEIPRDKPIVVHCASGYRSAIASSLLRNNLAGQVVLDVGVEVEKYKKAKGNHN